MHFQGLLVEVAQGIVVFPSLSLSDSLFANSNNVHPSGSVHSFSPIEEDRYMYIFYIQWIIMTWWNCLIVINAPFVEI